MDRKEPDVTLHPDAVAQRPGGARVLVPVQPVEVLAAVAQATTVAPLQIAVQQQPQVLTDPTDEELARIVQVNKELNAPEAHRAFEELYKRLSAAILRHVHRWVLLRSDAEDLSQDTWADAWEYIERYRDYGYKFSTWLFAIATNKCLAHFRDSNTRMRILRSFFACSLTTAEDIPDEAQRTQEDDEAREVVRREIEALPQELREVAEHKYIRGHTDEQTADLLDISVGTVKSRALKARKNLLEKLVEHFIDKPEPKPPKAS